MQKTKACDGNTRDIEGMPVSYLVNSIGHGDVPVETTLADYWGKPPTWLQLKQVPLGQLFTVWLGYCNL